MIRNGLPDPDSDADRHQNVISWSLGHAQLSVKFHQNPLVTLVTSKFRTSDSWIRMVIRIVTKIYPFGPWSMPYPSKEIRQNPFTTFSVIRRTDRQTDRSENITSPRSSADVITLTANHLVILGLVFLMM